MDYKEKAKVARIKVLEMIYKAQSSHIGSNFSVIDILTVLFEKANLTKDKIILSAGWKAAAFYYFLAEKGIIPKEDLDTFCKEGSKYIGLTEPGVNGIEFAGGSMGMGLPAAVGFALAKKIKKEQGMVYVIISEGEVQCGTFYESILIAAQHKLSNLQIIIDHNGLQAMGKTSEILECTRKEPLDLRLGFMGVDVHYCNGHNFNMLHSLIGKHIDYEMVGRIQPPTILNCETTKGKGVSFMEYNNLWHYKAPNKDEYELALKELNG